MDSPITKEMMKNWTYYLIDVKYQDIICIFAASKDVCEHSRDLV